MMRPVKVRGGGMSRQNGKGEVNMSVNFSLEGKIALVTGASYGIGFSIAKAMANAGATIVFNDLEILAI